MPLGLGKVVILEYIEVALGLLVVNDIGVAGSVSKRKVWRRGPNRPMRTMLCVRRSPSNVSPTVMMPVVGSVLFVFWLGHLFSHERLQHYALKIT